MSKTVTVAPLSEPPSAEAGEPDQRLVSQHAPGSAAVIDADLVADGVAGLLGRALVEHDLVGPSGARPVDDRRVPRSPCPAGASCPVAADRRARPGRRRPCRPRRRRRRPTALTLPSTRAAPGDRRAARRPRDAGMVSVEGAPSSGGAAHGADDDVADGGGEERGEAAAQGVGEDQRARRRTRRRARSRTCSCSRRSLRPSRLLRAALNISQTPGRRAVIRAMIVEHLLAGRGRAARRRPGRRPGTPPGRCRPRRPGRG